MHRAHWDDCYLLTNKTGARAHTIKSVGEGLHLSRWSPSGGDSPPAGALEHRQCGQNAARGRRGGGKSTIADSKRGKQIFNNF
ncbi:hypothetical protein EVAR_24247_1 [Eumeta japonica]|uniref:Uncharacterized protein n=1 Tax=Eumeta variegata TaxID=151549 RepID=A0A4C1W4W7_EUMVA|nr:hypothetical protein EVAR_24247_1 [Eumeta japonica]